jgi:hypothetical protein
VLAALGAVGDLSPFAIPANKISLGLTRIASTLEVIHFWTVLTDKHVPTLVAYLAELVREKTLRKIIIVPALLTLPSFKFHRVLTFIPFIAFSPANLKFPSILI